MEVGVKGLRQMHQCDKHPSEIVPGNKRRRENAPNKVQHTVLLATTATSCCNASSFSACLHDK